MQARAAADTLNAALESMRETSEALEIREVRIIAAVDRACYFLSSLMKI